MQQQPQRRWILLLCILVLQLGQREHAVAEAIVAPSTASATATGAAATGLGGAAVEAWPAMPQRNWIILQSDARADAIIDANVHHDVSDESDGGGDGDGDGGDVNGVGISFPYVKRKPVRTYKRLALRQQQQQHLQQPQHPQQYHYQKHAARRRTQRRPDILHGYGAAAANESPQHSHRNYTLNHAQSTKNNNNNNNSKRQQELRLIKQQKQQQQQKAYTLAIRRTHQPNEGENVGSADEAASSSRQRRVADATTYSDIRRHIDSAKSKSARLSAGVATHKTASKRPTPHDHNDKPNANNVDDDDDDDDDADEDDEEDDEDAKNVVDVDVDEQKLNEILTPLQNALERVKSFCDVVQDFIASGSGSSSKATEANDGVPGRVVDHRDDNDNDDDNDDDDEAEADNDNSITTTTQRLNANEARNRDLVATAASARTATTTTSTTSSSSSTFIGTGRGKKLKKKLKKLLLPLLIAYKLKFLTLIPVLIGGLTLLVGTTGLAGFFFALFTAVMSLKSSSGGSKSIVVKHD